MPGTIEQQIRDVLRLARTRSWQCFLEVLKRWSHAGALTSDEIALWALNRHVPILPNRMVRAKSSDTALESRYCDRWRQPLRSAKQCRASRSQRDSVGKAAWVHPALSE
jgi:hypothetical protein